MSNRRAPTVLADRATSARTFVLDQRIRYSYSAPVTDLRQFLRIIPPAAHGDQQRRAWQLRVEGVASSKQRTYTDRWGNVTVAVKVPRVDEAVEFVMHAEIDFIGPAEAAGTSGAPRTATTGRAPEAFGALWTPTTSRPPQASSADGTVSRDGLGVEGRPGWTTGGASAAIRSGRTAPAAERRHLGPTRLTAADAAIATLARDLPGPSAQRPADISALCQRVHASIAYQWGITGVHTTASEALRAGRGVCQDYAHIMLAVCRLVGVPARYVSGHLTGEGGSHAWVEVLTPHAGRPGAWTIESWDPTHNRRTNADYLVVAVGRDYADAAPLWGTFEGDGVDSTLVVDKRLSA